MLFKFVGDLSGFSNARGIGNSRGVAIQQKLDHAEQMKHVPQTLVRCQQAF